MHTMLRVNLLLVVILSSLLICTGCADFRVKSEFQKGKELQKQYEYQSAINKYEAIVNNYSMTQWADSARSAIEECNRILKQIDEAFEESSRLLEKGKYDEASTRVQVVLSIGVNEAVSAQVKQRLDEIDKVKKGSFEYIVKVVTERMNRGASAAVALGEFEGLKIKWKAIPGTICMGLSGTPVAFKKGKGEFFGIPSYGLDKLKFLTFCEANEGKPVTVEGTLISASDWPGTPLIVEVNALSRE